MSEISIAGHSKPRPSFGAPALVDACLTGVYQLRMPSEPTTQVAFRLPDRLLARIDRHAKRLAKEQRGVQFTRTDAIRDLLSRALDEVEGKDGES
jgi:hypothetical protein